METQLSTPYYKRRDIWGWAIYDLANTSYTVIVVTVAYAVYFRSHVVTDGQGDLYWGIGRGISMIIVGVFAPWLGAIADRSAKKKLFIAFYSILCIVCTALLMTVGKGDVVYGLALFIISNIGFQGALSFYDAFLPEIAQPEEYGRVSGLGFAVGYVGAILSLGLALPFAMKASEAGDLSAMAPAFPVCAAFFMVFAIPFFFMVPEGAKEKSGVGWGQAANEGFDQVRLTLSNLRRYPELIKYLIAYFFYIDGLNTVIAFGAIFATVTLGFTMVDNIIFFAVIQLAAIAGAMSLGILADKIGDKPTLQITLVVWCVVVIGAYLSATKGHFYAVGALAGAMMGATQSISRTMMGHLTPTEHTAEFFGFFSLYGKLSAVIGPLMFGIISSSTGDQRLAILSVGSFFLIGMVLMKMVDVEKGKSEASGGSSREL